MVDNEHTQKRLRRCFKKKSGSPRMLRLLSLLAALPVSLLTFDLLLPSSWVRWVLLPGAGAYGLP